MQFLVSVSLLVSCVSLCPHAQLSPELSLFQDFVRRYNRPYINDTDTFDTRFLVFKVPSLLVTTP